MLLIFWVCKPSVSHLYYEAHTKNTDKTGSLIILPLHTTWMAHCFNVEIGAPTKKVTPNGTAHAAIVHHHNLQRLHSSNIKRQLLRRQSWPSNTSAIWWKAIRFKMSQDWSLCLLCQCQFLVREQCIINWNLTTRYVTVYIWLELYLFPKVVPSGKKTVNA